MIPINEVAPLPKSERPEEYVEYVHRLIHANQEYRQILPKMEGPRRCGLSTLYALDMICDAVEHPFRKIIIRDHTPVKEERCPWDGWPDQSSRYWYMTGLVIKLLKLMPELREFEDAFLFQAPKRWSNHPEGYIVYSPKEHHSDAKPTR